MSKIGMLWQLDKKDMAKGIDNALSYFSEKYGGKPIRIELHPDHDFLMWKDIPCAWDKTIQRNNIYLVLEEVEDGDFVSKW